MNFKQVAVLMMELIEYLGELKKAPLCKDIEQAATRDSHRLSGARFLEDEVTNIQNDPKTLTMFTYELRCLDQQNKWTNELLHGQVTPPVLVDILNDNYFDSEAKKMAMLEGKKYHLSLNKGQQLMAPVGKQAGSKKTIASNKEQAGYSQLMSLQLCKAGFIIGC